MQNRPSMPMGKYIDQWKRNHDQTDEQVAAFLETTVDRLPLLAAEMVQPDGGAGPVCRSADHLFVIAEQHGVNFHRLVDVVMTLRPVETPTPTRSRLATAFDNSEASR